MRLDIPMDEPRGREIAPDVRQAPDERQAPPRVAPETPVQRRLESLREYIDHPRPHHPRKEPDAIPHERPRRVRVPGPSLDVHRRPRRIPQDLPGVPLREEEKRLLTEVGRFRVVRVEDLGKTIYAGQSRQLRNDLAYLREKNLIETQRVNLRHDGKRRSIERMEVVTLTQEGRNFLLRQGKLPNDQKLYASLVKPREAEHDSQIYRACLKEAETITKNGGSNLRVRLDFEIKSQVQKAIHRERKATPERDMTEIKREVAERFALPFVDGRIQIPDARIDYDLLHDPEHDINQGTRTGHEDIEVLTAAYHRGHLRAKAQAGFRNYASSSDRATFTTKIEEDHHLMENILEL